MAICMQDLDSAMFYALLRLRGEATVLKLKKKASKCYPGYLRVLASNKSCHSTIHGGYKVIAYVCSRKIARVDTPVQAISTGVRRLEQRARRAALTSLAIKYTSRHTNVILHNHMILAVI